MIGLDIFLVVFSTSHSVINSLTFNLYTEQDSDPYPGLTAYTDPGKFCRYGSKFLSEKKKLLLP